MEVFAGNIVAEFSGSWTHLWKLHVMKQRGLKVCPVTLPCPNNSQMVDESARRLGVMNLHEKN